MPGQIAAAREPRLGGSIIGKSLLFGAISCVAYLLSLAKTILVSRYFGTSPEMDAFTVAVLVPNLLGSLITGSAAAGLIPALAKAERDGTQERSDIFRTTFMLAVTVSAVGTVLLAVFAHPLIRVVASAFDNQRFWTAVALARWAAPLFVLTAAYAFASAELLARKKYALVAAAPGFGTVLSFLLIAVFHSQGVDILVWSLVAGTTLQAVIVLIPAWKASFGGRLTRWRNPHVVSVLATQVPLLAASTIGVANSFVDQFMGALLPTGNVSALGYATSLNTVTMQVVVMAMGWVVLPDFSAMVAAADFERLRRRVRYCIIAAAMLALPACLGIALFGHEAIRILFQHGRFRADSTLLVYRGWMGYSLGLLPAAVGMIAVRAANGLQQNWLLFRVGLVLLVLNAALDYLLMHVAGIFGISLSTSLVYCTSCVLMYGALRFRGAGLLLDRRILRRIGSVALATGAAAISAGAILASFGPAVAPSALAFMLFMAVLLAGYREAGLIALDFSSDRTWRIWQCAHFCIDEL